MRRHDALIPLTHDHHHALAQARKLRMAAATGPEERTLATSEFIDFFQRDTVAHFREEEEVVFPLVVDEEEAASGLARLMMEHLRIHALVRRLTREAGEGDPRPATLQRLSEMLEGHIRFEEKTFFPLIESLVESDLAGVDLSPRDRTRDPTTPPGLPTAQR